MFYKMNSMQVIELYENIKIIVIMNIISTYNVH